MNRFLIGLAAFFLVSQVAAQDLALKIPNDAFAVATVNSTNFFELLSVSEFNTSNLGKTLLERASTQSNGQYHSVEDFGIDLQSQLYVFSRLTDSITYYGVLVPLNDASKLRQLFEGTGTQFRTEGEIKILESPDKEQVVLWDDKALYMLSGSLNSSFFRDSVVAKKYGIQNTSINTNYYGKAADAAVFDADSTITAYEYTDTASWDTVTAPPMVSLDANDGLSADTIDNNDQLDPPAERTDNSYDTYYSSYAADDSIKNELKKTWLLAEGRNIMQRDERNSILDNKSFLISRAKNKAALASVWIRSIDEIYGQLIPEVYTAFMGSKAGTGFTGLGNLTANLMVDKSTVNINAEVEFAPEQAASYRRMYKRKLNKKFLNYVKSEKLIGFIGFSVNTQAYLEELPVLMRKTYGRMFGIFEKEIDLGASLFSLLLDEKAIGKAIKGDGLFVLNGLSKREVTYKAYEYDENFNPIETEKTKIEQVPDFLAMISSDDTSLLEKLLQYGISKDKIIAGPDGIYSSNLNKGIAVHALIKNGIVFIGTSPEDLQAISRGQKIGSISPKHRKLLTKNIFSMLVNSKNGSALLASSDLPESMQLKGLRHTMENLGDFYFTSTGIKGKRAFGKFTAEVPAAYENGLKYLLFLVGDKEVSRPGFGL